MCAGAVPPARLTRTARQISDEVAGALAAPAGTGGWRAWTSCRP